MARSKNLEREVNAGGPERRTPTITSKALKGILFAFLLILAGGFICEFGIQMMNTPVGNAQGGRLAGTLFLIGGILISLGLLIGLVSLGL